VCAAIGAAAGGAIGSAVEDAATEALARRSFTYFHGTDDASALSIQGQGLNVGAALANKGPDGAPGFYVTPSHLAAAYFAEERYPGSVLRVTIDSNAHAALLAAGAQPSTMFYGRAQTAVPQLFIPPAAFPVFNNLYRGGGIKISPE